MVREDALLDSTVGVMLQAVATETRNMIVIPGWHRDHVLAFRGNSLQHHTHCTVKHEEPEDTCIKRLVDEMLIVYKDVSAAVDVTTLSQSVTAALTSPVTDEAGPGLAAEINSET